MLSRRAFLKLAGLSSLAACGSTGLYLGEASDAEHLELVKITLPIVTLPREFEGYRIGFLADTHLGRWTPHELIDRAVRLLNEERIDLLLLGGDYIWAPEPKLATMVFPVRNHRFDSVSDAELPDAAHRAIVDLLQQAKAPDGCFGVLGNHDNWVDPFSCRRAFREGGMPLLENGVTEVRRGDARLLIVGVDDYWTGVPRVPLPSHRGPNEIRVIVSHNPDFLSVVLKHQMIPFDVGMAGHTHGGQMKLPFLPAPFYNVEDWRFAEGLVRQGRTSVYTSRGLGVVEVPCRINCPPEATVFELAAA